MKKANDNIIEDMLEIIDPNSNEDLKTITTNHLVDPIDAIEFYETDDGEYNTICLDQLYNLPSMIASKENIYSFIDRDTLNKLYIPQLHSINHVSCMNTVMIIKEMLYAATTTNFDRYIRSHSLLNSIGIVIDTGRWIQYDRTIESQHNPEIAHLQVILRNTLFDPAGNPIHSMYRDSDIDIDSTKIFLETQAIQIYLYISSIIAYDINNQIDIYKDYIKNGTEFIKNKYKDQYESMKQMFNILNKQDATVLFIKQTLAIDLYGWFESVLKNIVMDTVSQVFKTNYFLYNDQIQCKKEVEYLDMQSKDK